MCQKRSVISSGKKVMAELFFIFIVTVLNDLNLKSLVLRLLVVQDTGTLLAVIPYYTATEN